ncbi:MAG TPA: protein translocase subunit SecD, partial [Caulobacteraceae bacterium]|nr:protein translocase subunit SecD [Caulobacteraceae bacterium]
MLELPRWRVILCLAAAVFGLLFTLPNALPDNVLARMPGWLPHQKLNLGLDLQGGSYLQLEMDTNALKTERLNNLVEDVRRTLRDLPVDFSSLSVVGGAVSVRINDPGQVQTALAAIQKLNSPVAAGVSELAVTTAPDQRILVTVTDRALAAETVKAVDQDIEIVRRRIDALGTKEPSIVRQGADRIVVEAPGESDPEKLKDVIGKTAKLSFQMVDESVPPAEAAAGHVPPDSVLLPSDEGGGLLVNRLEIVSGSMLTGATQGYDQNGRPDINMRFNGQGAQRFGDATSQNIGKRFAIVLDNRVISAPVIQGAITGGSGEITGNFTIDTASNLALLLRSGALAAPLQVIEQRTVGAELGADSVRAGELAGIIALALVAAFMLLAYGGVFGGVAVVGLIVNMLMVVAFMTVGGAALTLPGIAGLILTIAMAVDANVL